MFTAKSHNNLVSVAMVLCLSVGINSGRGQYSADSVTEQSLKNISARLSHEDAVLRIVQSRRALSNKVQKTQKLLTALNEDINAFDTEMQALLQNDAGKHIATDPKALRIYIRLRDWPVTTPAEVKAKQDQASSLLARLSLSDNKPEAGFLPEDNIADDINLLYFWAVDRAAQLNVNHSTLKSAVASSSTDVNLTDAQPLKRTVEHYDAYWPTLLAEADIQGRKQAEQESLQIMVEQQRLISLERAKQQAELEKEWANLELEKLRLDLDRRTKEWEIAKRDERYRVNKLYQDAIAKIEYLESKSNLERAKDQAEKNQELAALRLAAHHAALVAKAESLEVQTLLAPFFAKSTYQHRMPGGSYDEQPVSLSRLKDLGALKKDVSGLTVLNSVATDPQDKVRPRWPYHIYYKLLNDEEKANVRQAQAYLLELGDVLVELGYLAR